MVTTTVHSLAQSSCDFQTDLLLIDECGLIGPLEFWATIAARYQLKPTDGPVKQPFDQLILIGDTKQMLTRPETFDAMSEKLFHDAGMSLSAMHRMIRNDPLSEIRRRFENISIDEDDPPSLVCTLDRCYRGPKQVFEPLYRRH